MEPIKTIDMKHSTGWEVRINKETVEQTRTIDFIASTSTKDRHGTVLNQQNWNLDNFNRNGIIGYQHEVYGGGMCNQSDPDSVIGTGKASMEAVTRAEHGEGKQMVVSVTFEPKSLNELAEKIFRKVLHGTLKATSVGFLPVLNDNKEEGRFGHINANGDLVDNDTFYYHGQELLELSIVNIPSNPDAVKKAVRSQTANALIFLREALGLSFGDLETMLVKDVLDQIEKGTRKPIEKTATEQEASEEAPEETTEDGPPEEAPAEEAPEETSTEEEVPTEEETEQESEKTKSVPLSVREKELSLKQLNTTQEK